MLHVLNVIIIVVLLPVLTSSFPQGRWKEMYEQLQNGYSDSNSPLEDRGVPLRRVLEELSHIQQEKREMAALQAANPQLLESGPPRAGLLPPMALRGDSGEGGRGDLLAKLLGGARASSPLYSSGTKRGGFVGAPASAGGPNMFGR